MPAGRPLNYGQPSTPPRRHDYTAPTNRSGTPHQDSPPTCDRTHYAVTWAAHSTGYRPSDVGPTGVRPPGFT
eukprot:2767567-Pyramimonas_sp.AAC.1